MFVVSLRPLQLRGVAVGPAPVPPMPPRLNGAQQPGTALRSHGHANQHAQSSGWPQCSSEPWIRLQGLRTSTLSPTICTFFLLLLYFEFSWYFWCLRVRFEDKQDNLQTSPLWAPTCSNGWHTAKIRDTAHIETSLRITPISPFHRRWTPLLLGNYGVHQHISFSECTWNKPKAGDDIRGEHSRWG